jgi:opacity protein-like surface antigen
MKRILTVVVLLLVAGAAQSQIGDPVGALAPKIRFGVHGNFTLSHLPGPQMTGSKTLDDAYGTGWGGGAHIDLSFLMFSFRLSGDYLKYTLDVDRFRSAYEETFGTAVSQINIDGGGLQILSVSANGKLNILPIPLLTPYITGGVGLAWLSLDETTTSIAGVAGRTFPSGSQSAKTTFNVGVGADITLGVELFVEARYVWIMTDGENSTYVPVTVGITF